MLASAVHGRDAHRILEQVHDATEAPASAVHRLFRVEVSGLGFRVGGFGVDGSGFGLRFRSLGFRTLGLG